jgi:hypothetical protein
MAGAFIIIPYTAFVLMKEMQHEHHDKVDFPHMHRESALMLGEWDQLFASADTGDVA